MAAGERGRPPAEPTRRIFGRLPAELIERNEAWRASQPVPPPKVRAIVYLIEQGLAAVTKDRGR